MTEQYPPFLKQPFFFFLNIPWSLCSRKHCLGKHRPVIMFSNISFPCKEISYLLSNQFCRKPLQKVACILWYRLVGQDVYWTHLTILSSWPDVGQLFLFMIFGDNRKQIPNHTHMITWSDASALNKYNDIVIRYLIISCWKTEGSRDLRVLTWQIFYRGWQLQHLQASQ